MGGEPGEAELGTALAQSEILKDADRVLFVHAHPDDETITTGGLIAELAAAGRSVWLVTATRGERGEVVAGPLSALEGTEELARERERELGRAAEILGVTRRLWLGQPPASAGSEQRIYRDSGMEWIRPGLAGPAADVDESALVMAPVERVVADLIAVIALFRPDVVISYDGGGGYGHPDHVRIREAALDASRRTGTACAEIHAEPGDGVEWLPLEHRLDTVTAALRSYATQLTVDGGDLVHSGGQRQPITASLGLRLVAPS